jgi:AraC-like DNA-binding protein
MIAPKPAPPRGLLNRAIGHRHFRHTRHLPSPELAPFIEHYWVVTWNLGSQPPYAQSVLPHPSVHMVFERDRSRIYGVMSGVFTYWLHGSGRVLGVKFRAGGFYPFLGHAVGDLANRDVPVMQVFGGEAAGWEDLILSQPDEPAMIARIEGLLGPYLPMPDPIVDRIGQIMAAIRQDRSITRVEQVVATSGYSMRALQRLFHAYIGVSPKWVIQRYRLHEAAEQLAAGTRNLADLAAELGYFDQAHFIHDFRTTVGQTPHAYAQRLAQPDAQHTG